MSLCIGKYTLNYMRRLFLTSPQLVVNSLGERESVGVVIDHSSLFNYLRSSQPPSPVRPFDQLQLPQRFNSGSDGRTIGHVRLLPKCMQFLSKKPTSNSIARSAPGRTREVLKILLGRSHVQGLHFGATIRIYDIFHHIRLPYLHGHHRDSSLALLYIRGTP